MFRRMFKPLLESGAKRQTIRPTPKRMPKVGDLESWRTWLGRPYWSGQEEHAQVVLEKVMPIAISATGKMVLNGRVAGPVTRMYVARNDGFESYEVMLTHFRKHRSLPIKGVLIAGKDLNHQDTKAPR